MTTKTRRPMKETDYSPATFLLGPDGAEPDVDPQHFAGYEDAAHQDRKWFAKRPHRRLRVRKPEPAELAFTKTPDVVAGYPAKVFVELVRPGVRRRRIYHSAIGTATPEPVAAAFLRLVDEAQRQGFVGEISSDDVRVALRIQPKEARH